MTKMAELEEELHWLSEQEGIVEINKIDELNMPLNCKKQKLQGRGRNAITAEEEARNGKSPTTWLKRRSTTTAQT